MRWRSLKEISGETGNFGTRLQCWRSLNGTHRVGLRERLPKANTATAGAAVAVQTTSAEPPEPSRYQEASQTGEGAVFGFGCGGCEEWSTPDLLQVALPCWLSQPQHLQFPTSSSTEGCFAPLTGLYGRVEARGGWCLPKTCGWHSLHVQTCGRCPHGSWRCDGPVPSFYLGDSPHGIYAADCCGGSSSSSTQ